MGSIAIGIDITESHRKEFPMAKVRKNVIVRGLSGSFGDQMVLKIDKAGRTIVSNKPEFNENRVFTPAQQVQQERFREAAIYARDAREQEVYIQRAEGTPMTPANIAMADWFHAPEIKEINLSAWTGEIGQVIWIQALDDVEVQQVSVVIADENDVVLEQGLAGKEDGSWWTYKTTATASGNPKILVAARDLPGHITQMTKNLN
jgi:hypothetical protein